MSTTPNRKFISPLMQFVMAIVVTGMMIGATQAIGRSPQSHYQTPQWAVAIHLLTVIPALLLGGYVNYAKKGDARHRLLGKIWTVLMLVTAIVSFWIRDITGHIGPIHIFSIMTLISLPLAIYQIRKGNIAGHRRAMRGTFIGLCAAGIFALTPGRILGNLIFG